MRAIEAGLAILLLAGCSAGDRWDQALARMKRQPRYDAYASSGFFRDGKAMQAPVEGTVPREREAGSERAVPAGPELLALGRGRFRIFCAACHGAGGYGGSIVAENLPDRPPPSLRRAELRRVPDQYFYQVITIGIGRMPSYAVELTPRERWAVVAYLRWLQARDHAAPDEREDSLRGARIREPRR